MTPETETKYNRESWKPFKIETELLRRAQVLQVAEKDSQLQESLRQMCALDIAFFINNFCWIYEPRAGMEHNIPWILYPHEYKMIDWLQDRFFKTEDGMIEKSREMGATWTFCIWLVWHFLYDDDFSALIGSRKEDLVDNKTPDSIFGKIDYLIDHLPYWLMPVGWNKDKHRNYMKLTKPRSNNAITGESTNPAFSRSGRYSCIVLDEFAYTEKSFSIWQAAADSSSVRIAVSTPHGKGNKFSELTHNPKVNKLTLHWRLHPEKDDAWYENQKARRTDDEIAEELDISYERSQRGRVYKNEWDVLVADKRLTDVPWDPIMPVSTSWDFGIGDQTAINFFQETREGAVRLIDSYENSGKSIDHYIKIVEQKPYRYYQHYGDITITRKELGTGKSVWELLRSAGIKIRGKVVKKKTDSINATKLLLRKMYIEKKLSSFIDAIQNYHYEWDEDKQVFGEDPVHDWSSHQMDSLSYFAINHKPYFESQEKTQKDMSRYKYSSTTY
jgi:hypothetical protein